MQALIELAAEKPDEAPIGVFMLYNRPPFTLAVKTDSPFKTPADLVGHKLGGPANAAALKLLPAARLDLPLVFDWLFILAAFGVALYAGFSLIEGRVGRSAARIFPAAVRATVRGEGRRHLQVGKSG